MSNFEHKITEDSTEFEKAFLKIYDGNLWTALDKMKDWKPPKPLVVVPQIIADAIESIPDYYSAYGAIKLIDMKLTELPLENEDWKHVYDWIFVDDNANKFVKAWIDGYTVEKPKEKLYFVKLPGTPSLESYMCKSCSPGEIGYHKEYSSKEPDKIYFSNRYDKKHSGGWQRQFTESEIKAIDERYWTFAVPVKEVEP